MLAYHRYMNNDLKRLLCHPILSYRAFKFQVEMTNNLLEKTGTKMFKLPRWSLPFTFIVFCYLRFRKK